MKKKTIFKHILVRQKKDTFSKLIWWRLQAPKRKHKEMNTHSYKKKQKFSQKINLLGIGQTVKRNRKQEKINHIVRKRCKGMAEAE